MTAPPVRCLCRACEQAGDHAGRGLCEPCYRRHDHLGDLDRFPTVRGDQEWRERYRLDPAKPRPAPPTEPAPETSGRAWSKHAACLDADPELFFPISESNNNPQVQQAKAVCRACPVRDACLDWALRAGEPAGVWGGLTSEERRRRRAAQPERTIA